MRVEAADYLTKARHCIANARGIAAAGIPDVAAREAYLAGFHAAEAYIYELTGKAAKTHRGVRTQFSRLAQREPRIDKGLLDFLRVGYELKSISDYGIGRAIEAISAEVAASAISTAEQFVARITEILA